jgi:ABC-type dipeptide/oligopeptide/nickel transport system ATPase component
MTYAIQAEGLMKRFGEKVALDGVDLAVRTGTVLGVLGPNGAGKTTAVRILATLLRPDGGRAMVDGHDVVRDAHQVRRLIGLTGQYASVDEMLTGTENLVMIGRLLTTSAVSRRPRVLSSACGTSAESPTGASSVSQTPPGIRSVRRSADSTASRVLPAPPGPVRVTRRFSSSSLPTRTSSCSRPTKLVSRARRLVRARGCSCRADSPAQHREMRGRKIR